MKYQFKGGIFIDQEGGIYEAPFVQFSPDNHILATFAWTAKLWDAQHGTQIDYTSSEKHGVLSMAFSRSGKLLAEISDGVYLWDMQTKNRQLILPDDTSHARRRVAFLGDRKIVVGGSMISESVGRPELVIHDITTGTQKDISKDLAGSFMSLAVSPDQRWIGATSTLGTSAIVVWDATGLQQHLKALVKGTTVLAVMFSPNSKYLVAMTKDADVHIWNVGTRVKHAVLKPKAGVHETESVFSHPQIALSSNSKILALTYRRLGVFGRRSELFGVLTLWDMAQGKLLVERDLYKSPKRDRHERSALEIHQLLKQDLKFRDEITPSILPVVFSPDGKTLVVGLPDGSMKLFRVGVRISSKK